MALEHSLKMIVNLSDKHLTPKKSPFLTAIEAGPSALAPKKCCPKNHVLRRRNIGVGGDDDLVCESISSSASSSPTRKEKHLAAASMVGNMGFLPEEVLTFRREY